MAMPKVGRNSFDRVGDTVSISHPDWDFVATASIRDDYAEEFESIAWTKKGDYLYSGKLRMYLHVYIMKKWYGDDFYKRMSGEGYVVDHMDNNGRNCCINNLCFLLKDENTAKGLTFDKYNEKKTHIALSMYKDFSTDCIQITIVFNYPAVAKISSVESPAVVDLAYILYDRDYPEVINDAKAILFDYKRDNTFELEKLHYADYHIEGAYGEPVPKEVYDRYIAGEYGGTILYFDKKAPIPDWKVEEQRCFLNLRGEPKISKESR